MIWAALAMGFMGSLHCLGMCSPLAMSVTSLTSRGMLNRVVYHSGRIITYGLLGAIIALIGFAFPLVQYQNLLSLLVGFALVVISLVNLVHLRLPIVHPTLVRLNRFLKVAFGQFVQRRGVGSMWVLGMINGVLPCGLSGLALTACVVLPSPQDGFIFMAAFGVATLPALTGFSKLFYSLLARFQLNLQRATKVMLLVSGVLLIARVFLIHSPAVHTLGHSLVDIICR